MSRDGRSWKQDDLKRLTKLSEARGQPRQGRQIINLDKHIRIAPKHPNMGKR